MTLWLILALMTALAIFAVIWPLAQKGKVVPSGSDAVVYRDQLNEVERDLAAGSIGKIEAEAARVEISRRLLAAAEAAEAAPAASSTAIAWYRRTGIIMAILLLTVGAAGLYLRVGSPGLASGSLVARHDEQLDRQTGMASLIAKVEEHLKDNPKDGRGWEVLAPVYMQLRRYSDAVTAWRSAIQYLGESADRQANLGEALMAQANGVVTPDAQAAFTRAVRLDASNVSARYYLGVAAEQDGRREDAAKIWRELIADAPPGAHWVEPVRTELARVEGKEVAPPPEQANKQMDEMVRGMVSKLAERLKRDGSDVDGWMRLVRSYVVLGEREKAADAAKAARESIGADAEKRRHFDEFVKSLGLSEM